MISLFDRSCFGQAGSRVSDGGSAGLVFAPHPTHFSLSQALATAEELKPKRTILTHINHKFEHSKISLELPIGVELAYGGMAVEC